MRNQYMLVLLNLKPEQITEISLEKDKIRRVFSCGCYTTLNNPLTLERDVRANCISPCSDKEVLR